MDHFHAKNGVNFGGMKYVSFKRLAVTGLALCCLYTIPGYALSGSAGLIASGDVAWTLRAEGHVGSQADAAPIQRAIDAYTAALDITPDDLEARWKLLRAFHFKGEYVLSDRAERHAHFALGKDIAEAGRKQIERQYGLNRNLYKMKPADVFSAVGDNPLVAEWCFWSSANWGLWAQNSGRLAALFAGVVSKIHQFAEVMVLMDASVEEGGSHRLRGRLHFRVPKIPFFTGWVDRDLAISEIRLSLEVAPDSLLSQFYLAEALLKFRDANSAEAIGLLRQVVASQADPRRLVEDLRTQEQAKELLTSLGY
jgi:tetratricopeptide (TPR) repeat protein